MTLNWTLEVTISLISLIPTVIGFLIALNQYNKMRNHCVFFMTLAYFFMVMDCILLALSKLFLSSLLFILTVYTIIAFIFCYIIFLIYIFKESINPTFLLLLTALSSAVVVFSFDPNATRIFHFPSGEIGLTWTGNFLFTTMLAYLVSISFFLYYVVKIFYYTPDNLKKISSLNLIGAICLSILSPISAVSVIVQILPGIHLVFQGIGALLMTIAFQVQPKLYFIPSFRNLHHIYFYTSDGGSIYDQAFKAEANVSANLVAGGLTGISALIQEVTKTETELDILIQKGRFILLEHGKYVSVALVTEKNHIFLRDNLRKIVKEVEEHFSTELEDFHGNITPFKKIKSFVDEIFVN